jgi:hypothetical protein
MKVNGKQYDAFSIETRREEEEEEEEEEEKGRRGEACGWQAVNEKRKCLRNQAPRLQRRHLA